MKYLLTGLVIALVTYGQLIIKYEVNKLGPIPDESRAALGYLVRALPNPGILSGLFAAALGAVVWIAIVSRYELSSVYPLLSLNFLLVPLLSVLLFDESLTWHKAIGTLLIMLGVLIFARSV